VTRDDRRCGSCFRRLRCATCSWAIAKAAEFILEETLAAAEADSEMAYRLATYFAVEGDESEALHWLRRAIYLGNENYPWFSKNPAWRRMTDNPDFQRILEDLKKSFKRNQKNWKRLLAQVVRATSRERGKRRRVRVYQAKTASVAMFRAKYDEVA
jgi:tetratricopeptide (TPR) repeat protein